MRGASFSSDAEIDSSSWYSWTLAQLGAELVEPVAQHLRRLTRADRNTWSQ